jgi:tripartite-type tricarboxylate transporter receptor subunit TctC
MIVWALPNRYQTVTKLQGRMNIFLMPVCRLLSAVVLATVSLNAVAQSSVVPPYPVRAIRLVVPYPAGAGTDLHARALAQKLTENIGQPVIVDNRGGANGTLAMEFVAKSAPDGYTLVYALPAQFSVNPALYPKLAYDPVRDFEPIMLVARTPLVLFVHPSVPAKSISELIKLAKIKQDALALASAGSGSAGHLCLELFKKLSGTKILHVPYKGAAPSMIDLIAGQAQLSFLAWSTGGGFVKTGKLRALGVTSEQRAKALPDLPAISETLVGYDIANWYGVAIQKSAQKHIVTKLHAEILRALSAADLRQAFEKEAIDIIGSSPEAFGDYIKSELVKWGGLVRSSGLKID